MQTIGAKLSPDHGFFDLVTEAYRVFACETPEGTGVCDCCTDRSIQERFFEPDIAELPLAWLQDWFCGAAVGGELPQQMWRYLLPRILEVLAAEEMLSSIALEVSLSRFPTGVAENWTVEEWSVLDRFQRKFLCRGLEISAEDRFDDVLCMFGLAGWPLDDLFAQVMELPTEALAARLWADWNWGGKPEFELSYFWEEDQLPRVRAFYLSGNLRRKVNELVGAPRTSAAVRDNAKAICVFLEDESQK